jgi:hypothetical protein
VGGYLRHKLCWNLCYDVGGFPDSLGDETEDGDWVRERGKKRAWRLRSFDIALFSGEGGLNIFKPFGDNKN